MWNFMGTGKKIVVYMYDIIQVSAATYREFYGF